MTFTALSTRFRVVKSNGDGFQEYYASVWAVKPMTQWQYSVGRFVENSPCEVRIHTRSAPFTTKRAAISALFKWLDRFYEENDI